MATPAQVLFQSGGTGVIVFAGQSLPAFALRADALKALHELARRSIECVRSGDTSSDHFRRSIQELHLEIAAFLLSLQDTARLHEMPLPLALQIGSSGFVHLDEPASS